MKVIEKNKLIEVISGANLLGTGGGGTIKGALSIIKSIKKPVGLVSISSLNKNGLICTVFGVGGKQNCNPIKASRVALSLFQRTLNKKVAAIIPVEIGPMAVANAMFIASELGIPLLDSDIVGLRSSPEIFLETITLADLKRTPLVIADDKGNSAILWESQSLKQLEQFCRNFAISVGGDAFVAGYPLRTSKLRSVVPDDSILIAQQTGEMLLQLKTRRIDLNTFCKKAGWKLLGKGTIAKEEKDNSKGFSIGSYTIQSEKNSIKIIFKNENIVILKNKKVILTCPDSISLLDLRSSEAVNNFENNINKRVAILGKKAISVWRTKKGRKLFSPKNLGLNYKQRLLI